MEPPNFKWALPHVAILGCPDHPKMYKWLLDQGISKLYSIHVHVPKQIKGTPKLENELIRKHSYQMLTCDELLKFNEIITDAKLFNQKIAFHDDTGCNHAAMIIAGYLQAEHPVPPEAIVKMVNQIQPNSVQQVQQQNRLLEFYIHLNSHGVSGHFFPHDPAEEYHSIGGRAKVRGYEPHSMLFGKERYYTDCDYRVMADKEILEGKAQLTPFPY